MVRDIPKTTDAMLDHIGAQSKDKGRRARRDRPVPPRAPRVRQRRTPHRCEIGIAVTDIEHLVTQQADPRMFECPVCESQYTSRLAAAECCDPAWEDS